MQLANLKPKEEAKAALEIAEVGEVPTRKNAKSRQKPEHRPNAECRRQRTRKQRPLRCCESAANRYCMRFDLLYQSSTHTRTEYCIGLLLSLHMHIRTSGIISGDMFEFCCLVDVLTHTYHI